jgi:hypothetical protein
MLLLVLCFHPDDGGDMFLRNASFHKSHTAPPPGRKYQVFLRSVRRLLVTANVVPSSPILVTLMAEAISSYETSVLTRVTRHNIPEDGILVELSSICCRVRSSICLLYVE